LASFGQLITAFTVAVSAREPELAEDAPGLELDPGGLHVVHGAGQRPGHPHDVPGRAGDDLQNLHPQLVRACVNSSAPRRELVGPVTLAVLTLVTGLAGAAARSDGSFR